MPLQERQLGRYRILEPLGSGGMSVVYHGHDTVLGRDVAVKVLHPHLAGKVEARRRLAQEAQAVARLRHPNILDVYDFSTEASDEAYLITELIRGQTLRQFLDVERLDPPEVAALVIHALAGALATAHDAGIIHRDLKPDNVMVREDGVLKLMDFGIAKVLDRDERMTMTGALMGSPAHMAPEVIEGEPIGPPADIFSLGTMFYLFVTGQLPFLGPNPTATLKRIVDGAYEDPVLLAPALSKPLAEILHRMLARRPEDRYPDAAALRDALADVLLRAGFERPDEELVTFFAAPSVARQVLTRRLVELALDGAEAAAASRNVHGAIDLLNQAQALDPENARALSLMQSLSLAQQTRSRRRSLLRVAGGAATALALTGAAWVGWRGIPQAPVGAPALEQPVNAGTNAALLAAAVRTPPSPRTEPLPTDDVPPPTGADVPPVVDGSDAARSTGLNTNDPAHGPAGPDGVDTGVAAAGLATAPTDHAPLATELAGDPGARPVPEPRTSARIRAARARASALATVPVEILIRPWAYVAVGDGPYSSSGLQTLQVKLQPGVHRIRLRCPFCEDTEEQITVAASADGEGQTFALSPALKPARLSFEVQPAGAVVEVEGVTRPASETVREPFLFRTPKGERPEPHEVRYTVSLPGYAPRSGTVRLNVGQSHLERATLDRP